MADLCQPTAENLRRIAKAYQQHVGTRDLLAKEAHGVADRLPDAANAFGRAAANRKRREDAEAKLRDDVRSMAKAGEGHVDVEAIIRRVRGES